MPRRGIDLTEDQWREVKASAAHLGMTMSEYLSTLVARADEVNFTRIATPEARAAANAGRPFTPAPKPGKRK